MLYPIKVVEIELNNPIPVFNKLEGYMGLKALVRLHGSPIGYVDIPVKNGVAEVKDLLEEIVEKLSVQIFDRGFRNWMESVERPSTIQIEKLFEILPRQYEGFLPLVTVAVCTRNRTADLAQCLAGICKLDYPNLDLLVIDNAPGNKDTEQLLKAEFPGIRYVLEPRPGLDWARNRAIIEAKGEIIAYADDDVIVDPGWVTALAILFTENKEVMAVTGLVVPYELETKAQVLFEMYGGFGRGFTRKFHQYRNGMLSWGTLGTGQFGTGANMAYRCSLFDKIGMFDPALDVGTLTNGGGDLEMFFRVLKEGYMLVYEPAAMVYHRHRREYEKLKVQISYNGKGLLAYALRSAKAYPNQRRSFIRLWIWWLKKWNLDRLFQSFFRPTNIPRELILAELKGCFTGLNLYRRARKRAIEIAKEYGEVIVEKPTDSYNATQQEGTATNIIKKEGMGIASIDLSKPVTTFNDFVQYSKSRYYFFWDKLPLGYINFSNQYPAYSNSRFIQMIVESKGSIFRRKVLNLDEDMLRWKILQLLQNKNNLRVKEEIVSEQLPTEINVSVVVATYDRPDDLNECLKHLFKQVSQRNIEIIVVDNNPQSGLTAPVVNRYQNVILINETKKGLSYARNSGISASSGKIILCTDDDVIVPPNWVESLVAPFIRSSVMVVTGNVLPFDLSTSAQQFFEDYGGLGRGFERFEVGEKWFQSYKIGSVPTWKLGATANAAFRASIFNHPDIGMINEKLGAGSPTGCSEDTYLFYKVLKSGFTLVYEPNAYVWHNHRTTMHSFRKQLYNYSKGHVAYHLETLLVDNDWRAVSRLFVEIPRKQLLRLFKSMAGRSSFPTYMILNEIAGTMAGPWALFRSSLRVKKLGKSPAYLSEPADIKSGILEEIVSSN